MTDTIVIYHGGCRDGFCAAWVVNEAFKEHQITEHISGEEIPIDPIYHPGYYGQEPPDVAGKSVIIVDFSYDQDKMWKIAQTAESLVWLDHHKTSLPIKEMFEMNGSAIRNLKWDFDMSKSGAGIAWDFYFPNNPRPWIVDYVEDRDLWNKKLPNTDTINAYIAALEFEFNIWDDASQIDVDDIEQYGQIAIMKTEQYVREVCKNVYFTHFNSPMRKLTEEELDAIIKDEEIGYEYKNIPTVNICQVDCSEVLHKLCELYPESKFSLYWFKRQDGLYQYGLRSIGDFDVSQVAKLFGGGGHKNAAGFQLPYLLEELK